MWSFKVFLPLSPPPEPRSLGGTGDDNTLMDFLVSFLAHTACIFGLICVHECGHFLAGWAGGIPARDMRIRLLAFPQHVALRFGDRWVSPFDLQPYLATMSRHLATTPRLYLYTAGGLLVETFFSLVATIILVQFGRRDLGFMVALMSACLFAIAVLVLDVGLAWLRGQASGDVSGLWALAKLPTAMLVLVLLAVRVLLLWYAAA